jgi:hypothetical protein
LVTRQATGFGVSMRGSAIGETTAPAYAGVVLDAGSRLVLAREHWRGPGRAAAADA